MMVMHHTDGNLESQPVPFDLLRKVNSHWHRSGRRNGTGNSSGNGREFREHDGIPKGLLVVLRQKVFSIKWLLNMGGTAEFGWGPDGPRGTDNLKSCLVRSLASTM
jgi:hypothetical protein